MATTIIGKVGITPQGEWSASRADYNRLDTVTHDGSSYMVIFKGGNVPVGTPVSDTNYFEVIADASGAKEAAVVALEAAANANELKETILKPVVLPDNLSVIQGTGYYALNGTAYQVTASGAYKHTGIIPAVPGDVFTFQNLVESSQVGSLGRLFNSGGIAISSITPANLVAIAGGYKYTVPSASGGTNVAVGFNFAIADADLIIVNRGSVIAPPVEPQLKNELLDLDYIVGANELYNVPVVPDNLKVILGTGYYASPNTTPYQVTASLNFNHCQIIPAVQGDSFTLQGMTDSLLANNIGRWFDSAGGVVATLTPANLVAINGGHRISPPTGASYTTIASVGFNFDSDDASNIIVSEGTVIISPQKTIKPELLPIAENSTDLLSQSDIEALELYARGSSPKKYTTGRKSGYVIVGQSNADGRAPKSSAATAGLPTQLPFVYMFNRTTGTYDLATLSINSGAEPNTRGEWAFDWGLYYRLQAYKADNIYVIKRTEGGLPLGAEINGTTVNGSFNAKFETINKPGAVAKTSQLEQVMIDGFAKAITDGIDVDWKCIILMQGESDRAGFKGSFPAAYYQNLKNWIAYVRGIKKNPNWKVVVGAIHKDNLYFDQVVRDAQVKVASEDPFVYFVNTDSLTFTHIGDGIHHDWAMNIGIDGLVLNVIKDF